MTITAPLSPLAEIITSERATLRVPSSREWISPVVNYLRHQAERWGLCLEETARRLGLVLEEALTNAIQHGNRERIDRFVEIELNYTGDRCTWTFTDQGEGFDFAKVMDRQGQAARGLLLMKAFADELRFEEGGRRLLLTLHRRAAPTQPQAETLPFLNPVEIFPVLPNRQIDYDHSFNSVCHELTAQGLCLLVRTPPELKNLVVGINACNKVAFLPARVESVVEVDSGVYSVYCGFPSPFNPKGPPPKLDGLFRDLRQSVDPAERKLRELTPQQEPGVERRRHSRILYQEQMRLVRGQQEMVVFALNLSKGGIALIVPEPLREKESYTLMMPQPSGVALPMPLKILRVRNLHDRFQEVAGEFSLGDDD